MIGGIILIGWRYDMELESIIDDIKIEYNEATSINGPFASAHEGYAILLEEVDELWNEIKKRKVYRDEDEMRREAIQVAAMAIRFIKDCCG